MLSSRLRALQLMHTRSLRAACGTQLSQTLPPSRSRALVHSLALPSLGSGNEALLFGLLLGVDFGFHIVIDIQIAATVRNCPTDFHPMIVDTHALRDNVHAQN